MCQKEHLYFLNGPEYDLKGFVSIHGIVDVEERHAEISEARLSIQTLEALEDGLLFVIPKNVSAHLCQVVGRVNYPFQKCHHGCPHIL